MYYIKYNGIDLTGIMNVKEVDIPSLPSMSHSDIDIFERNGSVYNGMNYGTRDISIKFIVKADDFETYDIYINDIKRAFYTKDEAQLYCGKEDLYIWCVPIDTLAISELGNYCAEGEVNLVAYDPYWYSETQNTVNNVDNSKFSVESSSDTEVYPIINIGFTKNTTFAQISNNTTGETILLGGIPTTEGTVIKENSKILDHNMESTTGWSSSTAPIDSGRSTGGTLAVTSTGTGLMCGDFGSSSSGSTWHGACYKHSLEQSLTNFKVKVRMSHNSNGVNGDPEHPYQNDSETVTSGSKTTYYKVTTSAGLILRKSARTSSAKLLTVPYGTKLTGTVTKGWLKTTYNGKTGYCYTKYLQKVTRDNTATASRCNYVTTKSTAIRATASTKATNKKTIPAGKCIRVYTGTKYPTTGKDSVKGKFFKLAKAYDGVSGYVWIDNLVKANEYTVDYSEEPNTANDKTGVVELYGFSSNNVQLFKLALCDDNEFYEFTYPIIRKNGEDFLVDKTVAPKPKTVTTYSGNTKKVESILSGRYGNWNEFYGELYIERKENKWYAYVQKIKDGNVVKTIKSKTETDAKNKDEKLSYLVIYIGTIGDVDKSSGMAISDIKVYTASEIDNTVTYNFQKFEEGDVITIDNSVPAVYFNDVEINDIIDVGSSFFPLVPGENTIKVASDDTPSVDILWNDRYL